MAHPKNKHSKQRTRQRRAHHALKPPTIIECPNCSSPSVPHRICPHCGFYNGVEYLKPKASSAS